MVFGAVVRRGAAVRLGDPGSARDYDFGLNRSPTPEGHTTILAVNTLAPYMLTALIERPRRLIYLSSGMHRVDAAALRDIDWIERRWQSTRAYSESKLYVTALAFAVARRWPEIAPELG